MFLCADFEVLKSIPSAAKVGENFFASFELTVKSNLSHLNTQTIYSKMQQSKF